VSWLIAAAAVVALAGAAGLAVARRFYRIRHQPTFPAYRPGPEAARWGNLARHERDPDATDILPVVHPGQDDKDTGDARRG
jgi:hypothetical protein